MEFLDAPLAADNTSSAVSEKIKAIRLLVEAGYALMPLNGKIPTVKNWGDIQPGEYGEAELANSNYGVVLKDDDLVIDVDPRNFKDGDKPLGRLLEAIGDLLSTFTVRTGGDGFHTYLKKEIGRA